MKWHTVASSWLAGALCVSVLIDGPTPAAAQSAEPKRGGTAVFAIPEDPTILLRNVASQTQDGLFSCIVYQGLMRTTAKGEIVPFLAKSHEVSEDGKTHTFVLQDAKWTDGKPLTSEDVKYTFLEVSGKHSAIFRRTAAMIETIETPSPNTVIVKLKQPYGPFMTSLTCPQGGGILPAHIFAGTDVRQNPAANNPVGLGPFKLQEWVRGSHLKLVKNPDYWEEGKPYLDEVIGQIIPSSAGRTQALLSGEIDRIAYFGLEISNYPLIQGNPRVMLTEAVKPPGTDMVFLNHENQYLKDKRVRQALFYAMDRDFIVQSAFHNVGAVATKPWTAVLDWTSDPSIDYNTMYPYDVDKANALLDEAGVARGADGKRFAISIITDTSYNGGGEIAAALKNMWEKIGVDVTIETLESSAASQRVFTDAKFDAFITGYISQGDPALGIARIFVTSSIGLPNGNAGRYSNPKVDELFERAGTAPTQEERAELYKEVQRLLAEELPVLTFHEQLEYDAQSVDLKGMEDETFLPTYREAWIDR